MSDLSIEELLNIQIVTAFKKAESLFEAPLGISAVTGDEIKKSGATSVMEALRLLPGVIVREQTPGNYDIHLRGFDAIDPKGILTNSINTITLVMINNRIVYNDFQGGTFWEILQVGISDIERIEVVRGPAAAMYGPNAVTGVINILTKSALDKEGFSFSTYSQGGNYNTYLSSMKMDYNFQNKYTFTVRGNYDRRNRHFTDYYYYYKVDINQIKTFGDYFPGVDASVYKMYDPDNPVRNASTLNNSVRYPDTKLATDKYSISASSDLIFDKLKFNLEGGYSSATVQRAYSPTNTVHLAFDNVKNYYGRVFSTYSDFTTSFDFNMGENYSPGSGAALKYKYNIINFNAEYDLRLGDNFSFRPGVYFRNSSYNGYILGSTKFDVSYNLLEDLGDRNNNLLSGFLRGEYRTDKFRAIVAFRVDKFKTPNKVNLSPQITATYSPVNNFLLRTSYSRASRSPFMFDSFMKYYSEAKIPAGPPGVFTTIKVNADGNPELELLTMDEAEFGARFNPVKWLSFDCEFFYASVKNYSILAMENIIATQTSTSYFQKYRNVKANPVQKGLTFSATAVPTGGLSLKAFVTFQTTDVKDYEYINSDPNSPNVGKVDSVRSFENKSTPNFFGGIDVNYSPVNRFNFNLNAYFTGKQTLSLYTNTYDISEVPANVLLNITVNYEFLDDFSAFVSGRNLLSGKKIQFGFADQINTTFLFGINLQI